MGNDETPARLWSVLTKTENGTVSFIRDLTKDEARQIYHRLNPMYGRPMMVTGTIRYPSPSDIVQRDVFGPPDWDQSEVGSWDAPWPTSLRCQVG